MLFWGQSIVLGHGEGRVATSAFSKPQYTDRDLYTRYCIRSACSVSEIMRPLFTFLQSSVDLAWLRFYSQGPSFHTLWEERKSSSKRWNGLFFISMYSAFGVFLVCRQWDIHPLPWFPLSSHFRPWQTLSCGALLVIFDIIVAWNYALSTTTRAWHVFKCDGDSSISMEKQWAQPFFQSFLISLLSLLVSIIEP